MKTLVATLIALGLATVAIAKDSTVTACTQDKKKVELIVHFDEGATDKNVKDVSDAFITVAKDIPYDVLIDNEGYHIFIAAIPQEDYDAVTGFGGVPKIVGDCK